LGGLISDIDGEGLGGGFAVESDAEDEVWTTFPPLCAAKGDPAGFVGFGPCALPMLLAECEGASALAGLGGAARAEPEGFAPTEFPLLPWSTFEGGLARLVLAANGAVA
jgi:hypothetical protein